MYCLVQPGVVPVLVRLDVINNCCGSNYHEGFSCSILDVDLWIQSFDGDLRSFMLADG
jgi:hypothetical protein